MPLPEPVNGSEPSSSPEFSPTWDFFPPPKEEIALERVLRRWATALVAARPAEPARPERKAKVHEEGLWTVAEIAVHLNVGIRFLRTQIALRKLKVLRLGKRTIRVTDEDLQDFIQRMNRPFGRD